MFFTLFGSCTLNRPTLARQLIAARSRKDGTLPRKSPVVITLFGSTEIKAPTLAEEFIDFQESVRSGVLSQDILDQYGGLAADESDNVFSLTLFGSFEEVHLPSEDDEVDGLALQRHLGNISDSAAQILQMGVGQSDAHRRAVVKQAVAANSNQHAVA